MVTVSLLPERGNYLLRCRKAARDQRRAMAGTAENESWLPGILKS
jgi:hypothetical protein